MLYPQECVRAHPTLCVAVSVLIQFFFQVTYLFTFMESLLICSVLKDYLPQCCTFRSLLGMSISGFGKINELSNYKLLLTFSCQCGWYLVGWILTFFLSVNPIGVKVFNVCYAGNVYYSGFGKINELSNYKLSLTFSCQCSWYLVSWISRYFFL